ncbi:hypothetical protein, partial [Shewanella xiamenensis]|uniref:hypothetical protein n=1 Tax=Shewanella xiamenensis TaxID=332186 RepID=UPI0035B7A66C
FLMSFSDYIVAHCEADLKWMGPFHYPCPPRACSIIHDVATAFLSAYFDNFAGEGELLIFRC